MVSSHWGDSCGIILYGNSILLMLKKPFFKTGFYANDFEWNRTTF